MTYFRRVLISIDWLFYRAFGEAGHCRANIEWDER